MQPVASATACKTLHRQEIDRLLDFKQSTSIGKIEAAFAALGKQLKIEVADAP